MIIDHPRSHPYVHRQRWWLWSMVSSSGLIDLDPAHILYDHRRWWLWSMVSRSGRQSSGKLYFHQQQSGATDVIPPAPDFHFQVFFITIIIIVRNMVIESRKTMKWAKDNDDGEEKYFEQKRYLKKSFITYLKFHLISSFVSGKSFII